MFYKYAVKSFFEDIKANSGFNFLEFPDLNNKHYFYNINFTFEDKVYKRLSQFIYEDRGQPFIFGMYNRGTLNPTPTQARQFRGIGRNIGAGMADLYTVKNLQAQTNICWVSNDPQYLMEFEEYFLVAYDRMRHYKADYEVPTDYLELGNIIAVNQSLKTFTINQELSNIENGNSVLVYDSTGNDQSYNVQSSITATGQTTITVVENIPSSVSDGSMVKRNAITIIPATIFIRDIESNQFDKLDDQSRGELTFLVTSFNLEYPIVRKDSKDSDNPIKIIKHINFKTKPVTLDREFTANDMTPTYDEINIDAP